MNSSLEEIEFLARSENRVEVLKVLSDAPCDRNDLRVTTGASNSTIRRILNDFEVRRWITRGNEGYNLTQTGGAYV